LVPRTQATIANPFGDELKAALELRAARGPGGLAFTKELRLAATQGIFRVSRFPRAQDDDVVAGGRTQQRSQRCGRLQKETGSFEPRFNAGGAARILAAIPGSGRFTGSWCARKLAPKNYSRREARRFLIKGEDGRGPRGRLGRRVPSSSRGGRSSARAVAGRTLRAIRRLFDG